MAKYKKVKKKNTAVKFLVVLLCIILLVDIGMLWLVKNQDPEDSADSVTPGNSGVPAASTMSETEQQTQAQTELLHTVDSAAQPIELPYAIENGRLSLEEIFEFNGLNPDSDNLEAVDVAAIRLKNTSKLHLKEANLILTMKDGSILNFFVQDLPAGKDALLVCKENVSAIMECVQLSCEAVFEEETPLMGERIQISVTSTEITLENVSDETIDNLVIYCHNVLEESYYGGLTYKYSVDSLAAGESVTVTALDCFLGMADVVRVETVE